jgi:hypothetical protein
MMLAEYGKLLSYDIAFWMQALTNPAYPLDELGKLTLELSTKLRALAIILLLVEADTDYFCHNLMRSGRTREVYLRRTRDAGLLDDHHRASGRYEPLLDAIASGDWALAGRIAAASPTEWRPGHEYEDDFCYAQLLHRLIGAGAPDAELAALLDRFEQYLDGSTSPRLDVCRALVTHDQAAFDAAFESLLADRTAVITRDVARGRLEEPPVVAERQVFVEGIAILRLAERHGLATAADYPYCPSIARAPMTMPFPRE